VLLYVCLALEDYDEFFYDDDDAAADAYC